MIPQRPEKPRIYPGSITVASLFSGVMGFDEGFVLAGFTPIWACEIDKKCQSVIRRHLPNVTIYDDINDLNPGTVQRPDVLIASPPCQDFSVAGKRQSLEGIRGYLSIKCVEFINRLEPDIVCIENVPGWLSAGGNAFGWFLGLLVGADTALVPAPGQKWTSSGMVTGCKRTACWTTLDSQFFNVAQRRERVFIVASPRKECASEILFERKSRGRDFKTLREAWKTASETVGSSSSSGSGSGIRETSPPLTASGRGTERAGESRGQDCVIPVVAHTLRAEADASEDGTGRETPLVCDQTYIPDVAPAVTAKQAKGAGGPAGDECQNLVGTSTTDPRAGIGIGEEGDPMFTLQSGKQHAVAFQSSQSGVRVGDTHATLDSNNGSRRHNGVIVPLLELKCPKCGEVFSDKHSDGSELAPAECPKCGHEFATETATAYRTSGNCGVMEQGDRTAALNTATDPNQNIVAVPEEPKQVQWASGGGQVENPTAQALRSGVEHNYQFLRGGFGVRRLTPTEAERLQGMPDGWTSHGMDEKGNMVPQSDSARYKQLGNAVTATVSFWIATRVKKFLLKS